MGQFKIRISPQGGRVNISRGTDFVCIDMKTGQELAYAFNDENETEPNFTVRRANFAGDLYEQVHRLESTVADAICKWAEPLLVDNDPAAKKYETCPICGQIVEPTDKITLEWYAPKQWWVFYHFKLLSQTSSANVAMEILPHVDRNPKFRFTDHCVRANYDVATNSFLEIPKE